MAKKITEEMLAHAQGVIAEIARKHGIPETEVRAEMMTAMRAGMRNPNPKIRKRWREIPWRGTEPTVEEFIAWMALKAESKVRAKKKSTKII